MSKEVKLEITGDETALVQSLTRAKNAVLESTASMREAMATVTESFKGLSEGFLAVTAILAGGSAFKEIIAQTKEITAESIRLGRSLGIATSEATAYALAIEQVGGNADDFSDASRGLTRQLKNNEKGLNEMGIATRDSAGNLRGAEEIMWDAIEAVNSYTAGTDRNLAAQVAFGRGASANSAILRLNREDLAEARKNAEELGLTVGQENVAAYRENRKATQEAIDVLKGLAKAIGDAVLPVLTQLGEWFRSIGPVAIGITKGVIGGLITSFWELVFVGKTVADILTAAWRTVADTLEGLFQAVGLAMQRKFAEAGAALKGIGTNVGNDWHTAFAKISADAAFSAAKIKALFSGQEATAAPAPGKSFNLAKKDKEEHDDRFAIYKNALEQMSQATGDFDHKDIAANIQYWQALLANTVGSGEKEVRLRAEIEREILSLKKRAHDEQIKADEEAIKTSESLQLGELESKRQNLAQQLALGNITRRQEAQALIELENEKFRIEQNALQKRLALDKFDLIGQQKLKDEEIKLEQKHALDVQKIIDKEAVAENKTWKDLFGSMQSGFQSTISGFLKGTTTIGGAVKGLFNDITGSVINSLASMAAKNLEVMLQSIVLGKTGAMAQIKQSAAAAGAGAYKAVVGIPYVGPFLAPAAAAVAYGATLAFGASASAKGGYDIPANVNPVVQTHAKEMILPEGPAETLRELSASGGGGRGMTFNVNANDPRSFARYLNQNGNEVSKALRRLSARNM